MINQILQKYLGSTPSIVKIDKGIQNNISDIVSQLDIGKRFAIVSDENTHKILGQKAEKALSSFKTTSTILKAGIADDLSVQKIRSLIKEHDAVIAIGSGTINDICKYASHCEEKPYIVLGTAPSMNGYSSANASISVNGHKKTLKAHLPKAILLDLDILANSPKRMIQSGLGDSVCRPTAQADWLLSHLLLKTQYTRSPFEMLKPYEQDLLENSRELVQGDREILELLANTLVLSGFGMYMCGGSYPASQGEHMIAHTMEMAIEALPYSFHGEQIAVTTLQMAQIIEEKMQSTPILRQDLVENDILNFFGPDAGKECINEYQAKKLPPKILDEVNHNISSNWNNICNEISEIFISGDILHKTLEKAAAPTMPSDIGWRKSDFANAVRFAKYSRNRFTFLDL